MPRCRRVVPPAGATGFAMPPVYRRAACCAARFVTPYHFPHQAGLPRRREVYGDARAEGEGGTGNSHMRRQLLATSRCRSLRTAGG